MKKNMLTLFCMTLIMHTYSQKTQYVNKDTTWTKENSPHFVIGELIIDSNVTLTIEPGSEVVFNSINSRINAQQGKFISDGVILRNNASVHTPSDKSRDSMMYFEGKYYTPSGYEKAKADYDKRNYETWLMPGLGYSMYQPNSSDSIGIFSGLSVEYLIYGKVRQNDDSGPSHVRWYARLSILKSDDKTRNSMFSYLLGVDMSLEKNPKRTFLIPYFGVEFGGLSQKQFGSTVQFTPTFGIHLLSKKNMYINVHGGYVYPIENFEALQGWTGQVGVNFALW